MHDQYHHGIRFELDLPDTTGTGDCLVEGIITEDRLPDWAIDPVDTRHTHHVLSILCIVKIYIRLT